MCGAKMVMKMCKLERRATKWDLEQEMAYRMVKCIA
jgi:hypothetical protein